MTEAAHQEAGREVWQGRSVRLAIARKLAVCALGFTLYSPVAFATCLVPVDNADAPATDNLVARSIEAYEAFGRVFADPMGCTKEAPGASPWAKGAVCMPHLLSYDDVLAGMDFLQSCFPDFVEVVRFCDLFAGHSKFEGLSCLSSGLPDEQRQREKRELFAIKITDRNSPVPEPDRTHFAISLSIHGSEPPGNEGGTRAGEDLISWAACELDPESSPVCATEGVSAGTPKRIMETSGTGPTAGEVLDNAVVYLLYMNPDGWRRGERTSRSTTHFQRLNGNGMDLARDWPSAGFLYAPYTAWSEPETRGYGAFLEHVSDSRLPSPASFEATMDLHSLGPPFIMVPSFSLSLVMPGDYAAVKRGVDSALLTWADQSARLAWSPIIRPAGECEDAPIQTPAGPVGMVCADQWGTVWDTINYSATGAFIGWMLSPAGPATSGVAMGNEMSMSQMGGLQPTLLPDQKLRQMHVDGNRGLVFAQITALLDGEEPQYVPGGRIAYVGTDERIAHAGGGVRGGTAEPQAPIAHDAIADNGTGFEFEVEPGQGALTIVATSMGLLRSSVNAQSDLVLDYEGPCEEGQADDWCQVASYFNENKTWMHAGYRIDLLAPAPGRYRVRFVPGHLQAVHYDISFSRDPSYPEPEQAPYDVSALDFFDDLEPHLAAGAHAPEDFRDKSASKLKKMDTLIAVGQLVPDGLDEKKAAQYVERVMEWVEEGGNLVLTDAALLSLPELGLGIGPADVTGGFFYAGYVDFNDGEGATYDRHPLAANIQLPGAAQGRTTLDGVDYFNRHQTYEPSVLGFYVSPEFFDNKDCAVDRCDSPVWIVDTAAWQAAGGTVAGRAYVRNGTDLVEGDPPAGMAGVVLGELKVGDGVIRIAGALLPRPSEANHHPFGLMSHALTYTGYALFENLTSWSREPEKASVAGGGGGLSLLVLLIGVLARRVRGAA